MAFRIYGKWARTLVNVLQSFQFFLNVTLLIESNGQGLGQMAAGVNNTGYLCCESQKTKVKQELISFNSYSR